MQKDRTGKIYGLFPITISGTDGTPELNDCFMNNYFIWLFEVMNVIEGFACNVLGKEHYFLIKMDKKNKDKDMAE